jgi:hypothetical protein
VNSNVVAGFPTLATIPGTTLMPQVSGFQLTNTCGSNPHAAVNAPCLDSAQYEGADQSTFGNLRRNSFYGPHYANTDATLTKQIVEAEGLALTLGAQAYNIFNHPNFGNPNNTIGDGSFGSITSIQAPPTSPYGSFQGAAITQRVLRGDGQDHVLTGSRNGRTASGWTRMCSLLSSLSRARLPAIKSEVIQIEG